MAGERSDLVFSDSTGIPLTPDTKVTFEMVKSQILTPKCLSCHSNASTAEGLNSWIVAGQPDVSSFFTRMEDGSMPKGASAVSTADLELARMYIQQLATSPVPAPTPTPDPVNGISFSELKNRVLDPYRCTSCHNVSTEARLANWIDIEKPMESELYTITNSGEMPQGNTKVSAENQAFILQYIKDYAARN